LEIKARGLLWKKLGVIRVMSSELWVMSYEFMKLKNKLFKLHMQIEQSLSFDVPMNPA
jgi:hypothetical protein